MPTGIAAADKKLLLYGGGVMTLLLTAIVLLAPPGDEYSSPVPSTYSAQSAGAKAAYVLLTRLHYPVRRWENPPTELPQDSKNVLLILAAPLQPPSGRERSALENFVKTGGHVIFTGANIGNYFSGAELSFLPPDPEWQSFAPSIPSRLALGVKEITLQRRVCWGRLGGSRLELYGDKDSAVVVSWSLGEGEIVWWAGSTPLTNAGITRQDNLSFFLDSVANWSQDAPYEIYWDEYFHGERASVWSYVGKTSLAWGFLQLGLLALAVLFTFGRRNGPTFVPAEVSRLSPLEFVDTLGGLYERANAASSAVSVSYARLRTLLTRQLGMATNTPNAVLTRAAQQRMGWRDQDFADLLQRAERTKYEPKLSSREALDLVQRLERQAARLKVRGQLRREKR